MEAAAAAPEGATSCGAYLYSSATELAPWGSRVCACAGAGVKTSGEGLAISLPCEVVSPRMLAPGTMAATCQRAPHEAHRRVCGDDGACAGAVLACNPTESAASAASTSGVSRLSCSAGSDGRGGAPERARCLRRASWKDSRIVDLKEVKQVWVVTLHEHAVHLDLSGQMLETLPQSICRLRNLRRLTLDDNMLQ